MTAIEVYRKLLNALVVNAAMHTGEISCVKGIQGLKGYPM